MKEASGELSMTLIVIIAAGAVLAIFLAFRGPIGDFIAQRFGTVMGTKEQNCSYVNGVLTCQDK